MADTDNQRESRATVDQLTQARSICGNNPFLLTELDDFLNTQPSRKQMSEFIEKMLDPARHQERFDRGIMRVCKLVGIDEPTAGEKLLALQIGLLQEQNATLSVIANKLDASKSQSAQSQSVFTPMLAGMLIGGMIAR